jgi:DNA-binding transcriptional regulator LsrR (DeoR family)
MSRRTTDSVPVPVDAGPASLVLSATIARRYYIDGVSKSDIAQSVGLSRFKVARLLDQARASGLVRIELDYRGGIDLDLSVRLGDAYGLRRCVVVDVREPGEAELRAGLGRTAAGLLSEVVDADDVLGLAWSRTLVAMRTALTRLAPCAVVQLTGALARPDVEESSIELVRDVARLAGGPAAYFYAPMLVPDAATAQALRTQPEVASTFARFGDVTKAVVGLGAWARGHSTIADAVSDAELAQMAALGVRAELGGILLDADGHPVATSLGERVIGIGPDQLRAVPDVVGLVYGHAKAEAVRAAIRGGFLKSLVTHTTLAKALLEPA